MSSSVEKELEGIQNFLVNLHSEIKREWFPITKDEQSSKDWILEQIEMRMKES